MSKYYVPTRKEVEAVQVGSQAPDCFGRMAEVKEVFGRGDDINGKAYVCYYTYFGSNGGSISNSLKEDELLRSVEACRDRTSWELDEIERAIVASR